MPAKPWLDHVKQHGCGALPAQLERELMAASRVEPKHRQRAINRVYEQSDYLYPDLFKGN